MAEAPDGPQCLVCNDMVNDPKLQTCNHTVCQKCLLDCVNKTERTGGCPLCRAPILHASNSADTPPPLSRKPRPISLPKDTLKSRALLEEVDSLLCKKVLVKPTPSLIKHDSQQRGRRGTPSKSGKQRIIQSLHTEVQLHKSENPYKPQFLSGHMVQDEEQETAALMRQFMSILNKMTPGKFDKLADQATKLKINTEERLVGITNLIFEKSILEPEYAFLYASLCYILQKSLPKLFIPIPLGAEPKEKEEDKGKEKSKHKGKDKGDDKEEKEKKEKVREVTFRGVLLTKCQREFEKEKEAEKKYESYLEKVPDSQKTEQRKEELEMEVKKDHACRLGTMKFIGELFHLKMLTETIMHDCIFKLLKLRDDDSIECIAKLLETVGKDLDHHRAKQRMDQYFTQLQRMVEDMRPIPGGELPGPTLCKRVKFVVLDILDLRRNGWMKRRIQQLNQPTRLKEVWNQVQMEHYMAQYLNTQPRQEPSNAACGGGARPKGRDSAQGDADGWNTVPFHAVKQQIEATRMKITKTNVDVNNLTIGGGNIFRNWSQGSQGGGSRSQEQEKQDSNQMLGASGGSFNPSSRNSSRDNSRSQDTPPAQVGGLDTSKMKAKELDRRINTIAEEFVSNGSVKDTQESIAELRNLIYSLLVTTLIEKLIERSGNTRRMLGQLLLHLVQEGQITVDDLTSGLRDYLQYAKDLELDVPKIWDYLAEVMGCLVLNHRVLPLAFLQSCLQPLVAQGNNRNVVLLSKTLRNAAEYQSKDHVQFQWVAAGFKLSDFGLCETEFKWLTGLPRNMVAMEVYRLMSENCSNPDVIHWIDENVSKEDQTSPQFVREFMTAFCQCIIQDGGNEKVNLSEFKYRASLVQRYVDSRERGTQALFAIQHLMCDLEHPQELAISLFELCYDEEIISKDSFFDWESRETQGEDNIGKGVVKLNTRDFFKWLRSGTDVDRMI